MSKRREFLKQGLLLTLFSACSFKFGEIFANNKNNSIDNQQYTFDAFSGCKNKGFEFSMPLPFDFKLIDELIEINNTYKKSKVTTLYGCLPANSNTLNDFISNGRGVNNKINNFADFAKYVEYAKNKGFKFIYLLNSPKPFSYTDFDNKKQALEELLENLKSIKCRDIKIANIQLLEAFKDNKDFNIHCSTSCEYTNIMQIKNLLKIYPWIKSFNIAIDTNRNIPMLKNLKKDFPNLKFELIVDESCIYGCPARIAHPGGGYFIYPCYIFRYDKNIWNQIFRTNIIYPWNLDYYAHIGYKNFKMTGIPFGKRATLDSVIYIRKYFGYIENGIKNIQLSDFLRTVGFHYKSQNILNKEIISFFPNINHFIKNGDKCSSNCSVSCKYCLKCADNINKYLTANKII